MCESFSPVRYLFHFADMVGSFMYLVNIVCDRDKFTCKVVTVSNSYSLKVTHDDKRCKEMLTETSINYVTTGYFLRLVLCMM